MKRIHEMLKNIFNKKNYYQAITELKIFLARVSESIATTKADLIKIRDSIYEYFLPIFEMWEFWLNNPKEYWEVLKKPYDNPWWSAACTMPSFIAMILHLVFWVINPTISDFILSNWN